MKNSRCQLTWLCFAHAIFHISSIFHNAHLAEAEYIKHTSVLERFNLENFHLNTHFRQSTSLTDNPNIPVLERVSSHSICYNASIIAASAHLIHENGISKADAASFLANHPNRSMFCNLQPQGDCPHVIQEQDLHCDPNYPYRSSNGSCNNLQHPLWGAAEQLFQRFIPADYEDGVAVPRGFGRVINPLPTSRSVSQALVSRPTHGSVYTTLLLMQWGQFTDHDLTLTPESVDLEHGTSGHLIPLSCCPYDNQSDGLSNPECYPITVVGDSFFARYGVSCLRFVRSLASSNGCQLGVRQQMNVLTNYVDSSNVYGSSVEEEASLRSYSNGRLLTHTKVESTKCPNQEPFPYLPEYTKENGEKSFFAGDDRVIEQPGLTSVHSLFLRVHNGIAHQFHTKYPALSDEEIYQQTRRIVGAIAQRITYGEFLPVVLGSQTMNNLGLNLLSTGHTNDYDPTINPTTPNSFGIAFRFGHTLISDVYHLKNRNVILGESFFNNDVTQTIGSEPSDFLEGLSHEPSELYDHVLAQALTNLVLAKYPYTNGSDLYARNIERGRDHGIPGYNAWRRYCGLPEVHDFQTLSANHIMRPEAVAAFQETYASVDDIDLFPGGISELPLGDGLVGPVFACIIGQTFRNIKVGDRFWFESSSQPQPFTDGQLEAIRSTTIASLICRYSTAAEVQRDAMLSPNLSGNEFLPCSQHPRVTVRDRFDELW